MLKITRGKVLCNHFEIASILIIEQHLSSITSIENCVVWMLMVMLIDVDFFHILSSQMEKSMLLKYL